MKSSLRLEVPCLLVCLLLLSGCGAASQAGPQNTPAAAGAIDACALLTKTDAEAILGQPVKDAAHPTEGSAEFIVSSCQYSPQADSSRDKIYVIAAIPYNGDQQVAKTSYASGLSDAESAYGAAPAEVPGLGDAAYWVAGSGNLLTMLKGNVNLSLKVSMYSGDTPPPEVIDLARVILGRLP